MGYYCVGQTYVTTQEAIRHGVTLFSLAVGLCAAGASALSAYLLLGDRPFFVTHGTLAKAAFVLAGSIGFWLGVRYSRLLTFTLLVATLIWSIVAAVQVYATWSNFQ